MYLLKKYLRVNRSKLKYLAKNRVEILLAKALETTKKDVNTAQRQAELARRICQKYNLRRPYYDRQLFCRKCKKFIIPGSTARVRLSYKPKAVKITCLECGHIYRKILQSKIAETNAAKSENKPK